MESFQNEFKLELLRDFTPEQVNDIITKFIITSRGYEIKRSEANIVTYNDKQSTEHMVELYLTTRIVEGAKPASVKNFFYTLRDFFKTCNKPYDKVRYQDVIGYLHAVMARGVKPQSAEKKREHIGEFYKWLATEEYLDKNPCLKAKFIKGVGAPKKALSRDELETVFAACETLREKALCILMYSTGCRIAEVAGIKIDDIKETDGNTRDIDVIGKGDKQRYVHLNSRAYRAVFDYLKFRKEESDYVFCSRQRPYGKLKTNSLREEFNKIIRRVKDEISFHPTPHTMRRTHATEAVRHDMPIELLQKDMGHSQLSTTAMYIKTNTDDVRQAHERCII